MPGFTYCHDHEVKRWETVPDDEELNSLLQDVRNTISTDWYLQVQTMTPRKRLLRKQPASYKVYTLYWYTGAGIEYQVINFITPGGGSVFHGGLTREHVMNYLMGMLNGWQGHQRRYEQDLRYGGVIDATLALCKRFPDFEKALVTGNSTSADLARTLQEANSGENTSPEVASLAARGIRAPESLTPEEVKRICASALTQKG